MNNYAYISFLSTDSYYKYIKVLYDSLIATNPKYPFYVYVTEDVSKEVLDKLDKHNIKYVKTETPINQLLKVDLNSLDMPLKYKYALLKLNIFNLTQFEKCVYLDADLLINKNLDELFKKPEWSAVPIYTGSPWFNSGLFVFKPNILFLHKIISKIKELLPEVYHDQKLLNVLNKDWIKNISLHLPYSYNLLVVRDNKQFNNEKILISDKLDTKIKVFHFVRKEELFPGDVDSFFNKLVSHYKKLVEEAAND